MKEAIEALIQRHLPFPGLVAWIARLKNGTCFNQRLIGSRLDDEAVKRSANSIVLTADLLRGQDLATETVSMVFEQARLCVAFRGDGACLVLLMHNNAETTIPAQRLLREFQET